MKQFYQFRWAIFETVLFRLSLQVSVNKKFKCLNISLSHKTGFQGFKIISFGDNKMTKDNEPNIKASEPLSEST